MKIILLLIVFLAPSLSLANTAEDVVFSKDRWEVLAYSGIKPNGVSFDNKSVTINVDQSASPLIYPLTEARAFKQVFIDADLIGTLKLNDNKQQGETGNDDFTLRIGLVYQGTKKLGFMKRQIAPAWVKKLFSLAPKNIGVSHVEFFTVFQDKTLANPKLSNNKLTKKNSDLMFDNMIIAQPDNGQIKTTFMIPADKNVLALWINSDGDDTKSKFSVKINRIVLR